MIDRDHSGAGSKVESQVFTDLITPVRLPVSIITQCVVIYCEIGAECHTHNKVLSLSVCNLSDRLA